MTLADAIVVVGGQPGRLGDAESVPGTRVQDSCRDRERQCP